MIDCQADPLLRAPVDLLLASCQNHKRRKKETAEAKQRRVPIKRELQFQRQRKGAICFSELLFQGYDLTSHATTFPYRNYSERPTIVEKRDIELYFPEAGFSEQKPKLPIGVNVRDIGAPFKKAGKQIGCPPWQNRS